MMVPIGTDKNNGAYIVNPNDSKSTFDPNNEFIHSGKFLFRFEWNTRFDRNPNEFLALFMRANHEKLTGKIENCCTKKSS